MPASASAHITSFGNNLHMVSLPVPITGFEGFITSWIYAGGPVLVVDVGPSSGTPHLLNAIAELGVSQPDVILLTHIHIDHAGGIGEVARAFPHTPVVCHPKAIDHVAAPQRLWQGSLKTLGEVARRYGPITPVPSSQLVGADQIDLPDLKAIPTPGHAPHQYSFLLDDLLFAGESGGVCIDLGGNDYYMRPATPPRLHLETYLDSIDRLIAYHPGKICYGHIGMQSNATVMLQNHRDQLARWRNWIQPWFDKDPQNTHQTTDACLAHLLSIDPLLAGFSRLSAPARERERFFLRNSLRGYWGYMADSK